MEQHSDFNARLQRAFQLHQAGEFNGAVSAYRELLPHFVRSAQFLYLLGSAECQRGHMAEGAQLLEKSLEIAPLSSEAHIWLGIALQALKRFDDALSRYDRAIQLGPERAEAHYNRGHLLAQLGRLEEALASYDRALRLTPDDPDVHTNRGNVLKDLGRLEEALASYDRALRLAPDDPDVHTNRGNALKDLGRLEEALASYDQAIRLSPEYAEAHSNRGHVLGDLGRLDEAVDSCDHALRLRPDYAEAHYNRGHLLAELGRLEEALASYDRAIQLCPEHAEAHNNRGLALKDLGLWRQALASYDRAIQANPIHAEALWNKSLLKLLEGDLEEGWQLYEWRWQASHLKSPSRRFSSPSWSGSEPLAGKTILVYAEQGLGDVIQFCRYLPMIDRLGAKILLEVPACLVSLTSTLRCNARIIESGTQLTDFDLQCPLMSLPLAFDTTLGTIPADVPYLFAEEQKSLSWQRKLGRRRGLRVGLVWSTGHDERRKNIAEQKRRDIPLAALQPLDVEGVEFYSLQVGAAAVNQLRALQASNWSGPEITDLTDEINDFSDTAALIDNLDLVISVCTSVAHLSGAMGKNTWVLLQQRADWRWLLDRSDSPWYPTATLFRQSSLNDWTSVVAEVREKLIELAERHRTSTCPQGPPTHRG